MDSPHSCINMSPGRNSLFNVSVMINQRPCAPFPTSSVHQLSPQTHINHILPSSIIITENFTSLLSPHQTPLITPTNTLNYTLHPYTTESTHTNTHTNLNYPKPDTLTPPKEQTHPAPQTPYVTKTTHTKSTSKTYFLNPTNHLTTSPYSNT